MTKKKPSPQNRIWEKERRERLNKSFEDLQRLLPDHDPNATLTKIEILQKAIELIGKLQKKIKDLIDECQDPLKEHVHEQDNRLQKLLARNDELMGLLRKAKVTIPPCKYTIEEQLERQDQRTEEKENGKSEGKKRKPAGSKKQSVIKKKPAPKGAPASVPVTDGSALSNLNNTTPPSSGALSVSSVAPSAPCPAIVTSALRNVNGPSVITGGGVSVSVTPALQPTPIMTTSVLITNNGRLLQMPLVTPPASLLIVGNEDVRAKLNLRKRSHSSVPGAVKGRPPKVGRFTIKSIDVIPGRIVNGKIPIAPLPRPVKRPIASEPTAASRATKLQKRIRHNLTKKVKKGKSGAKSGSDPPVDEKKKEKVEQTPLANGSPDGPQSNAQDKTLGEQNHATNHTPAEKAHARILEEPIKVSQKEPDKANQTDAHLPTTELGLSHTDLEEDLFANLHAMPSVPDAHRDANGDTPLSPTAAYLMNFPLVAGGGKAAGNHLAEPCEDENDECSPVQTANTRTLEQEITKKSSISYNDPTAPSAMTENYGSFFNYNPMDMGSGEGGSVPTTTSSSSTNTNSYATIYQSIDTMLEHRPVLPNLVGTTTPSETVSIASSTPSNSATTFTFTLTSTTTSTPATTQSHSTAANHYYTPSKVPVVTDGSLDCLANRKPPPVTPIEFTFSLTTTTAAPPRTVQSQYTNSTILATTMTTPSYDTYGYYHKTPTKTSSYSTTFNAILDPLISNCGNTNGDNITTEKPATSFTFCLTSTTKTQPSYTQSASSTIATAQSTQIFSESSVPKVSVRQQQSLGGTLSGHKMKDRSREAMGSHSTSDNYESDFHLQQTQQQQSKYDVSWMAEGRQEYKSSDHVSIVTQSHTASYNQYNNHQQHQSQHQQHQPHQQQQQQQSSHSQQNHQQFGYEYTSQLINPSIDYVIPPAAGYGANFDLNHPHSQNSNRKSDIFFAHPVGDEGSGATGLAGTWSSPSKLHDSSYFVPPVTLPATGNGGIELHTSGTSCKQASSSVKRAQQTSAPQEPTGTSTGTGSSFLSVSQLVDQSSKVYPNNNNGSGQGHLSSSVSVSSCQQHKPPNNSYSAEALIGNTTYNTSNGLSDVSEAAQGRKDKLYDYGCPSNAPMGELLANPSNTANIPFNFDAYTTPGTDYSKGYSFSNQFLDGGNAYSSLTATATPTGTAAGSGLYYGKTAAASSQGSYFHPPAGSNLSSTGSNYHTLPAAATVNGDGFPSYYLPSFTEKASSNHCSSGKHYTGVVPSEVQHHKSSERKSHKGGNIRPATDYVRSMVSNSSTSSVPSSASSSSYPVTTSSQFPNNGTTATSSAKTQPTESVSYPNYHQHQQHQQQQIAQHVHQRPYRSIPGEVVHSTQKSTHQGIEGSTASYSYNQYSTSSTHSYDSSKAPSKRQSSLLPPDESFNGIDTTSYTAGQSHHLDVAPCFNTSASSSVPSSVGTVGYGGSAPSQMPLYGSQVHHHHQPHHHHHHHHQSGMSGSSSLVQSSSGGTITNFNLSTICPEINDKTGRTAVNRGDGEPSVASIMTLW